jgi:quercetin dioxygenase-like cupin family protein
MTTSDYSFAASTPSTLTPEEQKAVWFLGALIRVRTGGDATAGRLAILEHAGARGYSSPLHRHQADEETFLILAGDVRVEVGEQVLTAGPGTAAFLPRQLPRAFVVTSSQARFLTLHTPAGFDEFTLAAGSPAHYPAGIRPTSSHLIRRPWPPQRPPTVSRFSDRRPPRPDQPAIIRSAHAVLHARRRAS